MAYDFQGKVMNTMELPPYSSQSEHVTATSYGCSSIPGLGP